MVPCRTISLCMTILIALTTHTAPGQLRQRHVTGVNISPQINNYLEHLPAGYNNPANASKRYPLIIYWKGLFDYDIPGTIAKGVPQKIESYVFPETVTHNGIQYSFIVITPMYLNDGCNATDVDATINYLTNNYRVDRNRIYMTGISKGGSLCYQYINASLNYAKKIAAIAPLAPCSGLSWQGGSHAVQEQIRVWGLHNPIDQVCNVSATTSSVFNINSQNPVPPQLAAYTLTPTNWTPDTHDIFWIPYEPGYSTPESGGKNMYDWFIQYSQNIVLPISLKDFTARLANGKVKLDWVTSAENNSESFTIERAGKDVKFTAIGKINAAGFSTGDRKYEAYDNAPLAGLSFYRLSQTDKDGQTQYFETRRILNGKQNISLVVTPNPVKNNITAFISVDRPQKLNIQLVDMQGRTLVSRQQLYSEGLQEIRLDAAYLAPGNYLLKVTGDEINLVEKIIRQ